AVASRNTAWRPCASAPAWARQESSRRSEPPRPATGNGAFRRRFSLAMPRPRDSADIGDATLAQRAGHAVARGIADFLVVECEADRRLDQADMGATVETGTAEAVGIDPVLAQQAGDGIGELD